MENFTIKVTEILVKEVKISAANKDSALAIAKDMYNKEAIVLDGMDMCGDAEFKIVNKGGRGQ